MVRAFVIVAVLVGVVLPGSASGADPQAWQTPSHNILCASLRSSLRCDMRRTGTPAPARPASCAFDYGSSFGITRRGRRGRYLCVSDAVGGPGAPVVRYGRTWKRDGFTCAVSRSGVRCTNSLGHGFELRIGRQRLF